MHIITAPTEINQPLYESQMELMSGNTGENARSINNPEVQKLIGPVVTLGQPQCWNLASLAREKGSALPAELALLLRNADFYLLELACSFRPERDSKVIWARLDAYLQPKVGQENPIAFDLYPLEVYNETKTDWKVNIAPNFKFGVFDSVKFEGALGEMITTINFRKLEPVVIGFGRNQANPGWDFEMEKTQPLRGVKVGYVIVKKPHGADAVRLILNVSADVMTQHGRLRGKIIEKDKAHLTQVVCID
jgi:hypothetical protein